MPNAAWKRIEKSPAYGKAKLFAKRLIGRELWLRPRISIEAVEYGDWLLCAEGLDESSIVYSLGIGDCIDFDLGLIDRFGLEVHAFDPTPGVREWLAAQRLPEQFRFYPWAVAAHDGKRSFYQRPRNDGESSAPLYTLVADESTHSQGIEVPAYGLRTIMSKLGHDHVDLLKMDIEGAEYEVLDAFLDAPKQLEQLLVEFHHRFPGFGKAKTTDIIGRLHAIGYHIFAVSGSGREVSFLRFPVH